MPHLMLPKTKYVPFNLPTHADWQNAGGRALHALSQSLQVRKVAEQINSVPDVWSRPILFQMALYDPYHPLHDKVLGEWRGLLAMLALKEYRNLTALSPVPVQLPSTTADDDRFSAVAARLAPERSLAKDTDWTKLYVFVYGQKTIGMTSPTTLVCTATDYANPQGAARVPWFDGRFLCDPASHLTEPEREELIKWLCQLHGNFAAHPSWKGADEEPFCEKFHKCLENYIVALGGEYAFRPRTTEECGVLNIAAGLYARIPSPPAPPTNGDELKKSYVQLICSRNSSSKTAILILDDNIPNQWQMRAQDIAVWGHVPLSTALPEPARRGGPKRIAGMALENAEWRVKEDFFASKLMVVNSPNAFPGSLLSQVKGVNQLERATPIVPLQPWVLEYLSPKDLVTRLSFETIQNGGIKVALRLSLSGPNPNEVGRDITIVREYPKIERFERAPILEIWPNFAADKWSIYFTYYASLGDDFHAKPYISGPGTATPAARKDLTGSPFEITRTSSFPDAMICSRGDAVGILPLGPEKECDWTPNDVRKIGIDFGTTGTSVFMRDVNNRPQALSLAERLLKISGESQRGRLWNGFFPPEVQDSGRMLSLFHVFSLNKKSDLKPLEDGRVLFFQIPSAIDASKQYVESNMKWGGQLERARAQAFLEQLCLQCAAECAAAGIGKVQWFFSFPLSFAQDDLDAFIATWTNIARACSEQTGLQYGEDPEHCNESLAAARFFSAHKNMPLTKCVCVDIGGGTSDIAVWREQEVVFHSSLQLAGRRIFLTPLLHRPEVLNNFQLEETLLDRLKDMAGKDENSFFAQADVLLNKHGEKMLSALPKAHGEPLVKEFLQFVKLGLSGLFFYVGSALSAALQNGTEKIYMGVGGNGARLLDWCAYGSFAADSGIDRHLRKILAESSGFPADRFVIKTSGKDSYKAEVGYGLVMVSDGDGLKEPEALQSRQGIMAGEDFVTQGVRHDWHEFMTSDMMLNDLSVPELKRFSQFLTVIGKEENKALGGSGLDNVINQVRDLVNQDLRGLSRDQTKRVGNVRLEPLFILSLKKFLKITLDGWREEAGRQRQRATKAQ